MQVEPAVLPAQFARGHRASERIVGHAGRRALLRRARGRCAGGRGAQQTGERWIFVADGRPTVQSRMPRSRAATRTFLQLGEPATSNSLACGMMPRGSVDPHTNVNVGGVVAWHAQGGQP
jgi:hypothetical protein